MKNLLVLIFTMFAFALQAQTGHVLQGAGAVNFSMGGAGTALPVDVLGALQWNPASITSFKQNEVGLSVAYFTASPEVYSKVPTEMPDGQGGFIVLEGTTEDELGASPLPTLGAVFAKPDSKFAFGISGFGISGFGVDYPATTNLPIPNDPNFDPTNSNPILYPQRDGFGDLKSEYQLMQVGLTAAYEVAEGLSIGLAPTFNWSSLLIQPVPIAVPDQEYGYMNGERTSALGFGFQAGVFYQTDAGLNFGLSYKSTQWFEDLEIEGTYVGGSPAPTAAFNLDYPAIISAGIGYTGEMFDVALDYRFIDYKNTDGFSSTGWVIAENGFPNGAVAGFGWDNVNVFAAGVQLRLVDRLPIRFGYTFSTNPINEDNVFFSVAAPAVIEHAAQAGLTYAISDNFDVSLTYHRGFSGETTGSLLNPMMITEENPLGKVPGSEITSKMHTAVGLIGLAYHFGK